MSDPKRAPLTCPDTPPQPQQGERNQLIINSGHCCQSKELRSMPILQRGEGPPECSGVALPLLEASQ